MVPYCAQLYNDQKDGAMHITDHYVNRDSAGCIFVNPYGDILYSTEV